MLVYDDNGVIVENDLMQIQDENKNSRLCDKRFSWQERLQDLDDI